MKVKFLSAVAHDNKPFAEGDTADLPTAAAKALIDGGAAEPANAGAEKAAAEKAAAEKAE